MADVAPGGRMDTSTHLSTYGTFLRFTAAGIIHVGFVLVALCNFAFGGAAPRFMGFAGLILGTLAVLIDLRMGSRRWLLSLGLLVLYALITAISVA